MAAIDLVDSQTFLPSDIDATGHIYTSGIQTSQNVDSIKLVFDFEDMNGDTSCKFQGVIETQAPNGNWYPIAYQFDPYRSAGENIQMEVELGPKVFWLDAGISNIVWVGGKTIAEISTQQGTLPDNFRVCVSAQNPNNTFVDLTMSIYGETFNAS